MKRLLAAAAVLTLVSGAAWLVLRHEERKRQVERLESRLLSFDELSVEALVLTAQGADWRFQKSADGWRLTSPIEDAADVAAIGELLGVVGRVSVAEVVEDPESLSAYGLDPPRGILRLEGTQTPALHIGEVAPTQDGLFARVEGRPGVLVLNMVEAWPLHDPTPDALRDPTLTGLLRSEINGLEIGRGASRIRLRREAQAWWIIEPLRIPASGVQVERLLVALEEAQVGTFIDDADPADPRFGLGEGALEIVLHTSGQSRRIALGSTGESDLRFAARDDRSTILAVASEPLVSMPVDIDSLATTRLTNVNRYRVNRFEYRNGAAELSAALTQDGWATSEGRKLVEEDVYSLLARILEARVSSWSASGAAGEAPVASLDFVMEDGAKDRIDFYGGNRARVASLAHVTYRLASPPPPASQ